jgi:hypothetical protein
MWNQLYVHIMLLLWKLIHNYPIELAHEDAVVPKMFEGGAAYTQAQKFLPVLRTRH